MSPPLPRFPCYRGLLCQLLERFQKCSNSGNFSFPESKGTGFAHMLPHASSDAIDLIDKLLIYDPEER